MLCLANLMPSLYIQAYHQTISYSIYASTFTQPKWSTLEDIQNTIGRHLWPNHYTYHYPTQSLYLEWTYNSTIDPNTTILFPCQYMAHVRSYLNDPTRNTIWNKCTLTQTYKTCHWYYYHVKSNTPKKWVPKTFLYYHTSNRLQ